MSVPHTVADVIHAHVTLELECIDRMYLNVYQPHLQLEQHVFQFLREQRGKGAVSSRCFQQMTQAFVDNIAAFAQQHNIPVITFEKKQRKDLPEANSARMISVSSESTADQTEEHHIRNAE
jgi:hypothetical protein